MTDYHWLRNKSDEHRQRLREAMRGNLNALRHSRYSKRPAPAATCNNCPLAMRCPSHTRGGACVFLWERVRMAQAHLTLK